jgi:hypothetical protein
MPARMPDRPRCRRRASDDQHGRGRRGSRTTGRLGRTRRGRDPMTAAVRTRTAIRRGRVGRGMLPPRPLRSRSPSARGRLAGVRRGQPPGGRRGALLSCSSSGEPE